MTSVLKVNQIQDIGGNTIVSSDGTGGFTNNLPAGKSGAFRNILINGDMSVAQRSTSESGITSGGYYTIDRFKIDMSSLGTWTQSQSTDVPSGEGFSNSLKMDCTTADASPSAADYLQINTRLEGQNLQYLKKGTSSAESLTLSFWVKSSKTGTYIAELYDGDNSRQISKSYTIDSANTWEKKTITYAGDTTGTFDNDNGLSLYCIFWLGAGTNNSSGTLSTDWSSVTAANRAVGQVNLADSTSNYINITGVQLEAGTTASDFEFLPVDVNLQRCFRYYETTGISAGGTSASIGTDVVDAWCQFKVRKRSNGYSVAVDTSFANNEIADPGVTSHDIVSLNQAITKQNNGVYVRLNMDGNFTAGHPLINYFGSESIVVDNEL